MKNSSVRLANISKLFGSTVAVENLDLNVEPGEFCTILGPSGCGKSTTLRILGGFEKPTKSKPKSNIFFFIFFFYTIHFFFILISIF